MAISSGLYSLAGVVVGSGVTWLAQWSLAARTDRLDTRLAQRQVSSELRRIRVSVSSLEGKGKIGAEIPGLKLDAKWKAHSDRLARHLSDRDWTAVDTAYTTVSALAAMDTMRLGYADDGPGMRSVLDDSMRSNAPAALSQIDEAIQALKQTG